MRLICNFRVRENVSVRNNRPTLVPPWLSSCIFNINSNSTSGQEIIFVYPFNTMDTTLCGSTGILTLILNILLFLLISLPVRTGRAGSQGHGSWFHQSVLRPNWNDPDITWLACLQHYRNKISCLFQHQPRQTAPSKKDTQFKKK